MIEATDEPTDPFAEIPSRWPRVGHWLFPIIGLLVFELTLDPMLGGLLACVRFGERDFGSALWLLRRDPNRLRAWACASAHLCCGLAWMGIVGIAVAIVAAIVIGSIGRLLPAVMMRQGLGVSLAAFFAIPLYSFSSLVLIATALIGRVKVWVSATNMHARSRGIWPPIPDFEVNWATNRVQSVIVFSFLLTPLSFIVPWAVLRPRVAGPPGGNQPNPILILLGMVAFVAYLRLAAWLAVYVAARNPRQCWPESESDLDTFDEVF